MAHSDYLVLPVGFLRFDATESYLTLSVIVGDLPNGMKGAKGERGPMGEDGVGYETQYQICK